MLLTIYSGHPDGATNILCKWIVLLGNSQEYALLCYVKTGIHFDQHTPTCERIMSFLSRFQLSFCKLQHTDKGKCSMISTQRIPSSFHSICSNPALRSPPTPFLSSCPLPRELLRKSSWYGDGNIQKRFTFTSFSKTTRAVHWFT